MKAAQEYIFFKRGTEPPSVEIRQDFLNPSNPESPYFGFEGNEHAIQKLLPIDFAALGRYNHLCNDISIAFIGPSGCGKTDLARRHGKANRLPWIEISPKSIKKVHDIFLIASKVCEESGLPLFQLNRPEHYVLPPVNIMIDEVHALPNPIVQGLLKATEHDDGVLETDKGAIVDCSRVHWMIGTTDRGDLFDAFDTRFSKVILNLYTKDNIAKIVHFHNDDWTFDICKLVAHYCQRIPREALAFAREMKLMHNMNPNESWLKIGKKVAKNNEIDEFGMSYKRLAILKALGQGPIAEKRLPVVAGVKLKELEKFILPWLMYETDDQKALLSVSHNGFCLTSEGINELDIRKIPHTEAA